MQNMTDNKSYRIQVLRGLSILAVVLIHNTPDGVFLIWCRPFINFCVGLFLFLSGMLSRADRWNPKKRIVKILIPYVIWTFVYVLLINFRHPADIPATFVKDLITAGAAPVMYYVFVYCELTLLIPVIDKLARSKYRWIGFLITPFEIIIMRLIPLVAGIELPEAVSVIMEISCLGLFIYYYLGYLLGNGLLEIKVKTLTLFLMWIGSIALQVLEGYWYYSMGADNIGTQRKLSSILTGVLFALLAYRYIHAENALTSKLLHLLGDYSFGIFFSHMAVMTVLCSFPHYMDYVIFPFNAFIALAVSLVCVMVGRKVLGKYAKYLAL